MLVVLGTAQLTLRQLCTGKGLADSSLEGRSVGLFASWFWYLYIATFLVLQTAATHDVCLNFQKRSSWRSFFGPTTKGLVMEVDGMALQTGVNSTKSCLLQGEETSTNHRNCSWDLQELAWPMPRWIHMARGQPQFGGPANRCADRRKPKGNRPRRRVRSVEIL